MILIVAKFGLHVINIYKVTSCETKWWSRFLAFPVYNVTCRSVFHLTRELTCSI